MGRSCGIGIAAFMCVLAVATAAGAQAIGGTVTDSTGAVLPGVTIEVRSPALIEQVRTAVSDGAGEYLIIALEPGTYTANFILPGFSTFVRDGIVLSGIATVSVDGRLAVGTLDETITVSGAAPLVDVQNVRQAAVMTREIIDTIPTGKAFNNFGVLVPGMTTGTTYGIGQDVGGQSGQSHQDMAIHGGAPRDQRIQVDGMSVSAWTVNSASAVWVSDGNFEEVQVDHSVISAEHELGGVRFNMIPRSGGNTFSSRTFFDFGLQRFQSNNITPELTAAGLPEANRLKELWSINPSVGGPIVRDKLWFFGGYTRKIADSYVSFYEDLDPNASFYTPGPDQGFDDQRLHDAAVRLTWQASARNKIQFFLNDNSNVHGHLLVGNAGIGVNVMPSSAVRQHVDSRTVQATWTSAVTSRLLFEAGVGFLPGHQKYLPQLNVDPTLPGIIEIAGDLTASRGMSGWYYSRRDWIRDESNTNARASVSYVTGSHSAKVGATLQWGGDQARQGGHPVHGRQVNFMGAPIQAQYSTYPFQLGETTIPWDENYMRSYGFYAQDQWLIDRLSINAGVRFDYFRGFYPDHTMPETTWGAANSFSGADVATWKDLSPRLGAVYDLRGDGRTAIKVTANRYVDGIGTNFARNINPALQNVTVTRTWFDGMPSAAFGVPGRLCYSPQGVMDLYYYLGLAPSAYGCVAGDGIPQGDPRIAGPNGELIGPTSNVNFGTPRITEFFDPAWANGWGKRFANWEFSAGVQHELTDGMSMNVSFFRRVFVNFDAANNRLQNAADFDPYSVTVPADPRLQTSGQTLSGLFEVSAAKYGQQDTITTAANNFGSRQQHWNGIDVTLNARMDNGLLVQGGVSSGTTSYDSCELNAGLNNPSQLYCKTQTPFLTQVKFLASYTLPGDVQLSGTFQSLPGQQILAFVQYTNPVISASLGRPSNIATTAVQVIEPGTQYSARLNQVDMRVSKLLDFAAGQARLMLDLYNLFNDSTPLELNNLYGAPAGGGTTWQRPQMIIPGRLMKLAFQFDF